MSVGNFGIYHRDGRLRGSYVYMLLCRDAGPIHVKIGMTDIPTQRLSALRTNIPIKPEIFAIVEVFSRKEALRLEQGLHKELKKWRTDGEWFRFEDSDKGEFNLIWQRVFERFAKPGWPLYWVKIPVQPLAKLARQRQAAYRYRWRVRGKAYQDFERADRALRSSQN